MSQVKIGWAMRQIAIDDNLCLFGQMYLRISQGILDPNMTTALVLDSGEGHAIFCCCDIEAHRGDSIQRTIKKVVAMRPEIDPNSIIMNVTHTHTGGSICPTPEKSPDGIPLYDGMKYREFVAQQSAEAIVEAWDNRSEGGIAYGYGYAVVGHSRRVIYTEDKSVGQGKLVIAPNGHGVMYGKTNDPTFSHYEAGADHFLNLLFTYDKANKLTGVVVNVPCPSQVSEDFVMQSADYWHDVRQLVKETFGEDVMVMPQCAAAGDLSPRILHYGKAQARRMKLKYNMGYEPGSCPTGSEGKYNKCMAERKDIAERIVAGISEVYAWAGKDIQTEPKIKTLFRDIPVSRRRITDEEKAWCEDTLEAAKLTIPDPNESTPEEYRTAITRYNSFKNRNLRALERYEEQKTDRTLQRGLHAVQVGDVAFATCPFETYMDYMHRIQARSPFIQTFVVQLCSSADGSYLPTERAMANKGYSASLFCNQVGAEAGQEIVETLVESLNQLAEN